LYSFFFLFSFPGKHCDKESNIGSQPEGQELSRSQKQRAQATKEGSLAIPLSPSPAVFVSVRFRCFLFFFCLSDEFISSLFAGIGAAEGATGEEEGRLRERSEGSRIRQGASQNTRCKLCALFFFSLSSHLSSLPSPLVLIFVLIGVS
jgi:hypothetical protein